MSDSTPSREEPNASPLTEALDKNKEATAEVKRAADDLAVVHAVLDTKIARGASDSDVKQAVDETIKVEKRAWATRQKSLIRSTRRWSARYAGRRELGASVPYAATVLAQHSPI